MKFWRDPSEILPDGPHYDVKAHLAHVRKLWKKYPYRDRQKCAELAVDLAVDADPPRWIGEDLAALAADLITSNNIFVFDEPTLESAPYLARMQRHFTTDPRPAFAEIGRCIKDIVRMLPTEEHGPYKLPLCERIDVKRLVGLAYGLYGFPIGDDYAFANLRNQLYENLVTASGYDPRTYDGKRKLVSVADVNDAPQDIAATFLAGTPFLPLAFLSSPFRIPPEIQFAHTWVCAGSGHGKTTALTSMVFEHIPEVLRGETSIVLIDSQNVIIPGLERLKVWEGSDRLIVIDPTDPIAFSLFDVPPDRLNGALDMIEFVFAKLAGSDVTYRQKNMFDYLSEFLITAVPDATIHDFRNMLDQKRASEYDRFKDRASAEVRDYLESDFVKEKFTIDARFQVLTKMRGMLRNEAFARMFGSPKTKLDLFRELERGVCILIKPDKYQLGDDGTRLFGRFWIAQMQLVAQQRQATKRKTPTYFYIDEAQDYLQGSDPKIEGILEQARKENIGLTLLHHGGFQFRSDDLLQLLGANTATKICGSPATTDLARFASYMQCEPRFIQNQQPKKSFAVHVRGLTKQAVSLSFPYINLAREPQMGDAAYRAMRARNRQRYGAEAPASRQPPPTPGHNVAATAPNNQLSDIELVITVSRRIETFLDNRYGAQGNGLHKKINSIEAQIPEHLLHRGRYIATMRNNTLHVHEFTLPDRDFFLSSARAFDEWIAAHENVKPQPTDKKPKRGEPTVNTDLDPDL